MNIIVCLEHIAKILSDSVASKSSKHRTSELEELTEKKER